MKQPTLCDVLKVTPEQMLVGEIVRARAFLGVETSDEACAQLLRLPLEQLERHAHAVREAVATRQQTETAEAVRRSIEDIEAEAQAERQEEAKEV